jgi:hypothetical protein
MTSIQLRSQSNLKEFKDVIVFNSQAVTQYNQSNMLDDMWTAGYAVQSVQVLHPWKMVCLLIVDV